MLFRRLLLSYCLLLLGTASGQVSALQSDSPGAQARQIEQRLGGRVGIYVKDTASGRVWQYRADQRFPMASTFKVLMCARLLKEDERADQRLLSSIRPIAAADLVAHSPVTKGHVNQRLSLAQLCGAALEMSDNTAANLVLKQLGGPQQITQYARSLDDRITRLDRIETALNEAAPGDVRDTTSPRAMASSLEQLLGGNRLSDSSREQLSRWMERDQVADDLLRAVVPSDWRVADKSGAGLHNTRNIVAWLQPPQRKPMVVAIYMTGVGQQMAQRDAAIRALGRAVVAIASEQ